MRMQKRYAIRAKTVDAYIKAFPKPVASRLRAIRRIVKKEAKGAEELISYSIPAYKLNGMLIYFAGFAHHVSIYPYTSTMNKLGKKVLSAYQSGRGTLRFGNDKPLPLSLIRKIVRLRVKEKKRKK